MSQLIKNLIDGQVPELVPEGNHLAYVQATQIMRGQYNRENITAIVASLINEIDKLQFDSKATLNKFALFDTVHAFRKEAC